MKENNTTVNLENLQQSVTEVEYVGSTMQTDAENESNNVEVVNVSYGAGHVSVTHGKKGLRLLFAALHFIAYFGLMVFTFFGGISSNHIIIAMLLYAVSASFWASEFMYLIKGKPHIILEIVIRKGNKKWAIILSHVIMVGLAFGLLALQFIFR